MMNLGQKLQEVNGMLGLFQNYWPTFKIQEGQAEAWAHALKDYSREELWKSLEQFRAEEGRIFAPSISELIGRTDVLKEITTKQLENDTLLIEGPKSYGGGDYEPTTETYTYKTSRTTPKRNKDDADYEVRKAVRVTANRAKEMERKYKQEGLRKVCVSLSNGLKGYEWV